MKTLTAIAIGFTAAAHLAGAQEEAWVPLFNGKDLSGWTPKIRGYEAGDNHKNTFRVEDGILRVDYSEYEQWDEKYGHLFHADKLSHYRLRLEYRFTGDQLKGGPGWALRNSGIMIHSEAPATMEKDQDFPTSLEVQLLGGDGTNKRSTGNLCTPGTHVVMNDKLETRHCIESSSETFHGDQWVTVEVEVHGGGIIKHLINGKEVITYSQPQYDESDGHAKQLAAVAGGPMISEGYICLQSESHPVEFRKIEVLILNNKDTEAAPTP
jgi:hypothetical protein